MTAYPGRDPDESDPDAIQEAHDAFMRRRGQLGRLADEKSTFITDQWAPILWAFFKKLTDEGFNRQEALQLVSLWFQATIAPRIKFPT